MAKEEYEMNTNERDVHLAYRTDDLKLVPNKELHITPDLYQAIKHYGRVCVISTGMYADIMQEDPNVQDIVTKFPRSKDVRWVTFAYSSSPTMTEDEMELWYCIPVATFLRHTTLMY